jgi:hypothetical protein
MHLKKLVRNLGQFSTDWALFSQNRLVTLAASRMETLTAERHGLGRRAGSGRRCTRSKRGKTRCGLGAGKRTESG